MEEPLTEELLQGLIDTPDLAQFVSEHNLPKKTTLAAYLQQLLEEHGLTRASVIRKTSINETHGYQIFTGQRGASRNKVLQMAFAMELSLKETNRLMQAAGASELYCKNRRDAIIIFCLTHGYSLQKADEELYWFGEQTIC